MVHHLIEFRFHGKAKYEIKKLVHEINRKFMPNNKNLPLSDISSYPTINGGAQQNLDFVYKKAVKLFLY